ncbi:MAG: hypothetical protein ACHQX1_01405 [Candidatus Micrarchaeales archaeon]
MTKKLKLNPSVSYVLGLCSYNKGQAIGIVTKSNEVLARFVKTSIDEFEIEPNKILVEEDEGETRAYFYNSKLKKHFQNALDRREKIFQYKNNYSANYFAGIFDMIGGRDAKGLFFRNIEERDGQLLEMLGFHTTKRGSKTYVMNENTFYSFIKEFTIKSF